jgi:hypothetical protein
MQCPWRGWIALVDPFESSWRSLVGPSETPEGAEIVMADESRSHWSASASAQQDPLAPSSPGPALRAGEARSEAMAHGPLPMAHCPWRMAHAAWRIAHCPWRTADGGRRIGGSSPWRKARLAGQGRELSPRLMSV